MFASCCLERLVARPRPPRAACSRSTTSATPAPHSNRLIGPIALPYSAVEALADRGLDERGVGLAAGRLHDLADEEADRLDLAGPVVGDGRRVGGEDLVDGRADGARVARSGGARAPR